MLDNLADAISPQSKDQMGSLDSTLAHEHGGERARLTNFNLSTVINELKIMRRSIFESLKSLGASVSEEESNIIHIFIDEAIQSSATSFALIQSEQREQLIATLSHDMRSPLTASTLSAEIILKKSVDDGIRNYAQKIKVNNRRVDNLIQDLLNTTMIRAGGKLTIQPEEVNLPLLLDELKEDLPPHIRERLEVHCSSIIGFWDRSHLKRAVENLVTNALKYGDIEKLITVRATELHGRVIIEVHNFGPPIPKEEQETIFQIFRRAQAAKDGKKAGWGLGLPIVRAVAEIHGGSISVNSFKDKGTTFILDIPKHSK